MRPTRAVRTRAARAPGSKHSGTPLARGNRTPREEASARVEPSNFQTLASNRVHTSAAPRTDACLPRSHSEKASCRAAVLRL